MGCFNRCCGCEPDDDCKVVSCGCGTLSSLIIAITLLALGLKKVDQNEVALSYCKVSRTLSDTLEDGLHSVCVDNQFFTYTRTFIDNSMPSLTCISYDGLIMDLTLTTQYRLDIEDLQDILFEFGSQEDLDEYIDVIIQDTVRDVCSQFTGSEFYTNRGGIESAMIANVTTTLDSANAHVTTGFFQLQNIHLPTELSDAINAKQLALEYVDVVLNEREQVLIEAETLLYQAQEEARILEIETQAAADARVISAEAAADARVVAGEAEAQAILDIATQEAAARAAAWNFTTAAIVYNIDALGVTAEEYVDEYLMPTLSADVLDPAVTACLQQSTLETAWWCWVDGVSASVATA